MAGDLMGGSEPPEVDLRTVTGLAVVVQTEGTRTANLPLDAKMFAVVSLGTGRTVLPRYFAIFHFNLKRILT